MKAKYVVPAVVIGLGILGWLAFGFFGIQAAFTDNEVAEDGPVFNSVSTENDPAEVVSTEAESAAVEESSTSDDTADGVADAPAPTTAAEPDEGASTPTPEPQIITTYSGTFSGSGNYSVAGRADVLTDGSAQRFVRFENFEASNGPDLKVYLRAADGEFINLGALKGNIGSQNYEIPPEVDLDVYATVQIWCERFSAEFGTAPLAAT